MIPEMMSLPLLCKWNEYDTCALLPCAELARQLNASVATVHKAAHILKSKGILSGGRGKRFSVIQAKSSTDKKPDLYAHEKAAEAIREYIRTPEAREQIRIPIMAFTEKLGYSHKTVQDALHLLMEENLVEKYGRYYAIVLEE